MIRMKREELGPPAEAHIVACVEAARHQDGSSDPLEVAHTAIAIALAWMDGAESWQDWKFVRGGEL